MKGPGKMTAELLRSVMKKPVTVTYPATRLDPVENFRGKISFSPEKCVGCKLCMRDCPSGAVEIIRTGDRQFIAEFRLDRCIYCAQCVDSCNRGALENTGEFELAQLDSGKLKIRFEERPAGNPEEKA